jgi:hypothetical protein
MQSSDDLQNAWMMFDHRVKHVKKWTIMACHIYDMAYCKVMTIIICYMQFKDMEIQCMLWRRLNAIIEKKKLGMLIFKGFMVNSV